MLGLTFGVAVLVGATLSLSSTAVVAEWHQQNCPIGQTANAILIFQDVAANFCLSSWAPSAPGRRCCP